jgi:hypothetical protein
MHIKRIGGTFLNLELMTDATIQGDGSISVCLVVNGCDETNRITFKGDEAVELIAYLVKLEAISGSEVL